MTTTPFSDDITLLLDAKARLGEGALWHPSEKKLYWVDIEGRALHVYDPVLKKDSTYATGERVGTVVPVNGGGVLLALQNGIYEMNTATGQFSFVVNPLPDAAIRFNDGKCDPAGRFWVGTMALDHRNGAGSLYRMDLDRHMHLVLDGVTISNGITWSHDKKTMYYIDSPTSVVQAFDYDNKTGKISNRRVIISIPKESGDPDGMTIDAEGKLWIALWGGGCIGRWDPATGGLLQKVGVPAPNVTSCAFGGENLDTLYITTASDGLSASEKRQFPLSGGLFAVRPGVTGVPAFLYGEQ